MRLSPERFAEISRFFLAVVTLPAVGLFVTASIRGNPETPNILSTVAVGVGFVPPAVRALLNQYHGVSERDVDKIDRFFAGSGFLGISAMAVQSFLNSKAPSELKAAFVIFAAALGLNPQLTNKISNSVLHGLFQQFLPGLFIAIGTCLFFDVQYGVVKNPKSTSKETVNADMLFGALLVFAFIALEKIVSGAFTLLGQAFVANTSAIPDERKPLLPPAPGDQTRTEESTDASGVVRSPVDETVVPINSGNPAALMPRPRSSTNTSVESNANPEEKRPPSPLQPS